MVGLCLAAERAHHSQVGYQGCDVARTRDNLIEDNDVSSPVLDCIVHETHGAHSNGQISIVSSSSSLLVFYHPSSWASSSSFS